MARDPSPDAVTVTVTDDPPVVPGVRIGGEPVPDGNHKPLTIIDPATGLATARVTAGGAREAAAAAEAAGAALPGWASTSPAGRAAALRSIAGRLRAQADGQLAQLITQETGKRRAESVAEIGFAADYFDYYAGLADTGGAVLHVRPGIRHEVATAPLGVVAVATPWNFPVSIPARKVAPALAAGCTVVVKPSELAPRCWLALADLLDELLPPGVVNSVCGDGRVIVETLLAHDRVRGVHFTGSVPVGAAIAEAAGRVLKPATLELGGRAPFVVLEDADVDSAVDALMVAKFRNNGASCIAANNVWVAEPLREEVTSRLVDRLMALRVGDPMDPGTDLGPARSQAERRRLAAMVDQVGAQAGRVVRGQAPGDRGFFVDPVVCLDVGDCPAWWGEVFGPVVLVRSFRRIDEVVADANRGRLGLAGYLCTADGGRARQLAARLDIGVIGVNTGTPNTPEIPFGGRRDSGIGYEGGRAGLVPFLAYQSTAYRE